MRAVVVRSAWKLSLLVGLCSVIGYFLLPGAGSKDAAYSAIGLASVGCVLVGNRRHRPDDRLAWYAIAVGNLAFVTGDGVYDLYQFVLHRPTPFPSVADAFYLAGYPFLIVGVARLTRRRGPAGSAREGYADAGIISIGALALSWHFLMGSYAADSTVGTFGKLVTLGYPVLDLGVLFIVVQGLLGRARHPAQALLATAMGAMVVADFVYDLLTLHGAYTTGNPVDAGWLVNYVLVGAAALHPTMAAAPGPVATGDGSNRRRLPLVALAGFVSPGILLVGTLVGNHSDVGALTATSLVLFGLVVVRMGWMFDRIAEQTLSLNRSFSVRDSLESELRHQAFHDSLTGLANRALFHDRVEHTLAGSAQGKGAVAVCFCDLDGFKTINDSLGHPTGDTMLQIAGTRLTTVVRPGDTIARLGGDEFAVLMEDIEDLGTATAVAERIVSVLRQPVTVKGRQISMSVSVGVAVADVDTTTEELLSEADSAMYAAKAAGKDRYEVFEAAMHTRIVDRLELTTAFDGALLRGEFYLEYQPQFALSDGRLEGFEALIRWDHPTLGPILPDRFIGLAEETGHIVPIGRWVIEAACEQAARWTARTGAPLTIAVNLSGRQIEDTHLVDDVRTAVALSGLKPENLILEITESTLIVDIERTLQVLTELKATGTRLAIDDFGTGYSSLSYLHRFPVDQLKIDKSFVDPLLRPGGEGVALIKTIVSLAHNLGLVTVVEGVEHPEQQRLLTRLGCDSAQGFLLARPLSRAAATDLLATHIPGWDPAEPLPGRGSRT